MFCLPVILPFISLSLAATTTIPVFFVFGGGEGANPSVGGIILTALASDATATTYQIGCDTADPRASQCDQSVYSVAFPPFTQGPSTWAWRDIKQNYSQTYTFTGSGTQVSVRSSVIDHTYIYDCQIDGPSRDGICTVTASETNEMTTEVQTFGSAGTWVTMKVVDAPVSVSAETTGTTSSITSSGPTVSSSSTTSSSSVTSTPSSGQTSVTSVAGVTTSSSTAGNAKITAVPGLFMGIGVGVAALVAMG